MNPNALHSGVQRLDVEFDSGGLRCRAWLYLPREAAPRPVLVMAHGLGGVRQMRLDAFAERFCVAGYAALVFDYRYFGASEGSPRQLLDIRSQLQDWAAALAFVRSRSDVDGSRAVLWGSSFSGGHVMHVAAHDANVAAVLSQCPFTDGLASVLAMDLGTALKVTALALRDQLGSLFGRPPLLVATAGRPGTAALMTGWDCEAGYLKLVPAGAPFQNHVAARIALHVTRYFPGRQAKRIAAPALFCVCEADTVAPAKATLRHVRKAPRGEVQLYPDGHFDIYVGAAFERAVSDQIAFLQRHVPPAESAIPTT